MILTNIYGAVKLKFLGNLSSSLLFSFFVSVFLHILIILSLCMNYSTLPTKIFPQVQEDTILVEMIDVKEDTNLALKYDENDAGEAIKKYSTIIKKPDEVYVEKVEDTPKPDLNPATGNEIKEEIGLTKPSDLPVKKPIPAPKSPKKVLKPSVKPNIKTEEELGSLLKSMDLVKTSVKNTSKGLKDGLLGKGELSQYSRKKPISQSVLSAIKSQFMHCWTVPVNTFEVKGIRVMVHVVLDEDGSVKQAQVLNAESYKNSEYFQIMASSAIKAVYKCNPIVGLPKESYSVWKEMELSFDPVDML